VKEYQNMENIRFEQFKIDMIDECTDLFIKVFSKEPWNDVYESKEVVKNYFKSFNECNKFIGYVVTKDEKIIGLSIGFIKPWIKGLEYYIDEFCIDDEFHGQGIGTFFLEKIQEDLLEKKINAMLLNTERQVPAFKFYVKNGFACMDELVSLGKEF